MGIKGYSVRTAKRWSDKLEGNESYINLIWGSLTVVEYSYVGIQTLRNRLKKISRNLGVLEYLAGGNGLTEEDKFCLRSIYKHNCSKRDELNLAIDDIERLLLRRLRRAKEIDEGKF